MKTKSRARKIRDLIELATSKPYRLFINGPLQNYNKSGSGPRGVQYVVSSDLTERQKKMICLIAEKWDDVVEVYVTPYSYRSNWSRQYQNRVGGNIRITFGTRAKNSYHPNEVLVTG